MKRFTAVPTLFVALVACQEPTKSATADSETSTPLSVRTTAGTFTVLVPTSGATGPSLAVFGSGNDTHCAGTAPSGTYMGNVVVNPNAVCNLSGSTVTGNLIARENATLIAENNDIRGNVELLQTGLVSIGVSVIGGSILGDKPKRGLDIYRSQIGGSILAKEGTAFIGLCGNTLKNGPIVLEKNRNSSILVGGDACVDFGGGNILENVDIKVDDNEVVVVSGVPSNGLQIGDNQIGQHLQVFKNRGGLPKAVTRNTVGASLQCFENTAPFVGEPNVAQEAEGDCKASPPAPVPVASVTVAPPTATVDPGKTVQLAATMRAANGTVLTGRTVAWTSSNIAVATVSPSGLVTGVAPSAEPASITATSEGQTGTAQITVPPVASVTVTPSAATVEPGKTVQLAATMRDANGTVLTGRSVAWASSNEGVATVSSSGLVTGVAPSAEPASITATSEGKTGTAQITVTAPPPPAPVASVTVTPSPATVEPGKTVQLTATTRAEDGTVLTGRTVTWASSNTAVATVSSGGVVSGVAPSSEPASITATSEGKTGTAQITVPPVASVTVAPSTATVDPGKTVQLAATTLDASGTVLTGRTVAWTSLSTAVATVSSSGLVTAVDPGSATIEATSEGKTGTAQITVPELPPPPPPPPPPSSSGIWISPAELAALPMSGRAWDTLTVEANRNCGTPNLANQDDLANVCIMATALVFARTNQPVYRDKVVTALRSIANSGTYVGRCLSLGRELAAYVIAADLIGLPTYDPNLHQQFSAKLRELRTTFTSDGPPNLIKCHEQRPNNWGTMTGASRVAVAVYLGDQADLDRAALVFRGYLGDRTAYASFIYGELSWQADPSKPVGINPKGATKQGRNIDGVQPDDQRRCGSFSWPPCATGYAWEVLQGSLAMAWMLHRQGYAAFEWSDRALLRAFTWNYQVANNPAVGDDNWQPSLINHVYGTTYATTSPSRPGKIVGWTDWTHPPR